MSYDVEVYVYEEGWVRVVSVFDAPGPAVAVFEQYAQQGRKVRITAEEGD